MSIVMGNSKKSKFNKISKRKIKVRLEDLPLSTIKESQIETIARTLAKQIDKENFRKKYAPVKDILKLVGVGAFLAASIAIPNLPLILKPFIVNNHGYEVWKRFNIPYLKRTLERLEAQKLAEVEEKDGMQIVKITDAGRRRILKYALDELAVEKPKIWDGKWRLISYDIPKNLKNLRAVFRDYLRAWGFYPLHESVFLHAYPCFRQVEFLREYLGIGEYVRFFIVSKIENDTPFKEFWGV